VVLGNVIFAAAVLSGIALIVIFEVRFPKRVRDS
jgi:hypothetical protein